MRTRFIKINDISEIDTTRVTVHDLNNRYIDRRGNMYGLRYNRTSKKVEVIKIIRTPIKSAEYYRQRLRQQKKEGSSAQTEKGYFDIDEDIAVEGELIDASSYSDGVELDFNPDMFVENTIELMKTHASRFNGIINNIKNSKAISERDRLNANQLDDIFRNLNIDGIQRIEKILATSKEIKEYPRSISYYLAKQNPDSKAIIDSLDSDTRKMSYVYLLEMYHSISNLYRTLLKILKDLNYFLENTHTEDARDLTFAEKQSFQDACISVQNSIVESSRLLNDLKRLNEYLSDARNF